MSVVLVTGLGGLIGKHCASELARLGYEVHGVTRFDPPTAGPTYWHTANLLSDDEVKKLIRKVRPRSLLHLAWVSDHPSFWNSSMNAEWLRASLSLVQTFANAGGERVVVSGSCAEYETPDAGPCSEERTPIRPTTIYSKAKAALHASLRYNAQSWGFTLAWARLFFVYGVGEPSSKLVASAIRTLQSGTFVIREPHRAMDFIYARDAGRALAAALSSSFDGTVNVGSGEPTSAIDIVNTISRLLGLPPRIDPVPRQHTHRVKRALYADIERLKCRLRFFPQVTLEDGILEMIASGQR